MTRFREEVYASKWYQALVKAKVQRTDHTISSEIPLQSTFTGDPFWRASRSEYFAKKAKKARPKGQKEFLDG